MRSFLAPQFVRIWKRVAGRMGAYSEVGDLMNLLYVRNQQQYEASKHALSVAIWDEHSVRLSLPQQQIEIVISSDASKIQVAEKGNLKMTIFARQELQSQLSIDKFVGPGFKSLILYREEDLRDISRFVIDMGEYLFELVTYEPDGGGGYRAYKIKK